LIILQKDFNLAKQIFFDPCWHEGSTLGKQFLDQVLQIDAFEALCTNDFKAMALEIVSPAALNESLAQEFLEARLLACFFQFALNEGLLEHDV